MNSLLKEIQFKFHYPDMVVRPDVLMLAKDLSGRHTQDMILWIQHGNYYQKFDGIPLYFLDFWFCYPRTPKCQFVFLTSDMWIDSLKLNDAQFKQIVTDKFEEYNLELIEFLDTRNVL